MEPGIGEGTGYGVPDTLEGRFDLIVLHLVLVLFQIGDHAGATPAAGQTGAQGVAGRVIGQNLFDEFCRDLDDNLREMGVGDLTVPKKMRGFAEAFYGRQTVYVAALAANDRRELENALARNIFGETKGGARPARLAAYVREVLSQFTAQGQDAFGAATRTWRVSLSQAGSRSGAGPRGHPKWLSRNRRNLANRPPAGPPPWHVPVTLEDIPEDGEHFDLAADADVRAAVAKVAGLRDLPRLTASFDVTPRGTGGLHVAGVVFAAVGQTCVVTLEPVDNEVEETVDVAFVPQQAPEPAAGDKTEKTEPRDVRWNDPEPLIGGTIDLGAIATEFLILGLDPYPRKPGAVFQPPHDDKPDPGPFADLAKLKGDGS